MVVGAVVSNLIQVKQGSLIPSIARLSVMSTRNLEPLNFKPYGPAARTTSLPTSFGGAGLRFRTRLKGFRLHQGHTLTPRSLNS